MSINAPFIKIGQAKPKHCTLDISSPNLKLIKHAKLTLSNVVESWYTPKKSVNFFRVCDHNGLICQLKRRVDDVQLFHRDGKPYLLSVDVKKGESRYFLNVDDKWTEIPYRKYRRYETYLIVLGSPENHITIDVNKHEDTMQLETEHSIRGDSKQIKFQPNNGYYAKAVVDGDTTIWKAENDTQTCFNARVYYHQNEKKLVRVWVFGMNHMDYRYYEFVNGQWKETDKYSCFKAGYSAATNKVELKKIFDALTKRSVACQ